jgi:hypothetical protein
VRPRGTRAATTLAVLSGATAVAFFVGAYVTYAYQWFFHLGALSWPGIGSDAARVIAALAGMLAVIQLGFGVVYVQLTWTAWRGRSEDLRTLASSVDVSYALMLLTWLFAGFALNFPALILGGIAFVYMGSKAESLDEPSRPAPPEAAAAVLKLRWLRRVQLRQPANGASRPMIGQVFCTQCGRPNAVDRRRCRVCAAPMSRP